MTDKSIAESLLWEIQRIASLQDLSPEQAAYKSDALDLHKRIRATNDHGVRLAYARYIISRDLLAARMKVLRERRKPSVNSESMAHLENEAITLGMLYNRLQSVEQSD